MTIDADQERELSFISGVNADGTLAARSFWTWNGDDPASYGSHDTEAKWGPAAAGTGATVGVAFDPASHWTDLELGAFRGALALWQAVAGIRFAPVAGGTADILISRSTDRAAETTTRLDDGGGVGSARLGAIHQSTVTIDTRVAGFGPLGAAFAVDGGYPWMTLEHELGHAIGLGHAGAYNEGQTEDPTPLTGYDSTGWSIMSYNEGVTGAVGNFNWGNAPDGSLYVPTTPMVLDIAAAQRLYGLPTDTPLAGGQVFGFHSNIGGELARFYDFTLNPHPVVTLWDAGTGNTLDASGFTQGNFINLAQGSYSSLGVQALNNVGIAYGTRIDHAIGGTDFDNIRGNDDGDVIEGNGGADILTGGAGNDHIYGNLAATVQGAADGNDRITTGGGTNYVNGNAGDDDISVTGVADRIFGGAGNDHIHVEGGSAGTDYINGNAGNDDIVVASPATVTLRGGQGDDIINQGGNYNAGNTVAMGDQGNDTFIAGPGVNLMTGGPGQDLFLFGSSTGSPLTRTGALAGYHDEITDFTPGVDKIAIRDGYHIVLHADDGSRFDSLDAAVAYAQGLLASSPSAITVLQVGADAYLLYDVAGNRPVVDAAIKLDTLSAASVHDTDFGYTL